MTDSETDMSGLGRPLPIKLSRIERFEGQPRRFFDPVTINELADNIQSEGQKTPVKVCRHANKPGTFILIGGERRWRAFHVIQERTDKEPTINAFVDAVRDHNHHFREALVDNLHREDLVPLDEASALHHLRHENGLSVAEIAKMVGKSLQYVEGRIKIHGLPDEVKKLMEPGLAKDRRLNVTSAVEIARSTSDQKLRVELAREVVERSLGVLETHSLLTSKVKSYAHFSTSPNEGKVDGRRRKVSDNYYIWRAHLERSLHDLNLHSGNFEIATLYDTRPSEELDRQRDLKIITFLIQKLEGIRKQVSETSRQRFERTGSV